MEISAEDLPIIPHENVVDLDCCGCLVVKMHDQTADIVCNECGALIETIPALEVKRALARLAQTDIVATARCPYCGAVNSFLGMEAIEAFVCRECVEGVDNTSGPVH